MTDQRDPYSDPPSHPSLSDRIGTFIAPGRDNVLLIYILYLVGMIPALGVIPIIIGFVMALLNREHGTPLEQTHYEYQVRQALIGLGAVIVSAILLFVVIGFLGFLLTAIWWIVRSVKGLIAINHHDPIPDPKTWLV